MAEMTEEKMAEYLEPAKEIISRYEKKERYLIPVLQEAQEEYGYLPEEVLKVIAVGLNLSLSQVYGVVTFYSQFHQQPRGNNIIRVCMGTACHVRGGDAVMDAIKDELGIDAGETTESVACIGACGLAPVIMVNDETHGRLTPEKIPGILAKYQ
jgi:NADH-quinone oxidoreductase subunit E/NADP-reducing hydrogenase subunit HndA